MTEKYQLPPIKVTLEPRRRDRRIAFRKLVEQDPKGQEALEWMTATGAYYVNPDPDAAKAELSPEEEARYRMTTKGRSHFVHSVLGGYNEWGSLTPKQYEAIKTCFDAAKKRFTSKIKFDKRMQETSFFGDLGEVYRLSLTVTAVSERSARRGGRDRSGGYTNRAVDAEGNVFCYLGPLAWSKGAQLNIRARVDKHRRVNGEARTYIKDIEFQGLRRRRVVD